MIDVVEQINATHRAIGDLDVAGGPGRSVLLRRTYDAPIEDVWDACTDRDRVSRWMGRVTGDLRPGGDFQVEGNASGTILRCEQPQLLRVTWALGEGMTTEVELRLASQEDKNTLLELEHTTPAAVLDELVRSYGPGGTIGIGGGWDLALVGLDMELTGVDFDPATWESTPQAQQFAVRSCHAWGPIVQAAWQTSDEDTAAGVAFGVAQFAPDELPD